MQVTADNHRARRDPEGLVRLAYQVRAAEHGDRSIDVIASTEAVDSYGEIVAQEWDLERYSRNPVVLYGHDAWADQKPEDTLPIGYAENVRVEDGALRARLRFVDERANPLAERIYQSMKQGSLRAVSVGFIPRDVRVEKRDGQDVIVLSNNELLEISVVAIPANPEAVAERRAKTLAALRRITGPTGPNQKDVAMKRVAKVLGLPEAASEDEVSTRIDSVLNDQRTLLDALETKSVAEGVSAIVALKMAREQLATQKATIEDLQQKVNRSAVESFLDSTDVRARITPALRERLVTLGMRSMDEMKAFVDVLPRGSHPPYHVARALSPADPQDQRRGRVREVPPAHDRHADR